MKTSELTGAALDWAVSLIEFPEPDYEDEDRLVYVHGDDEFHFTPSTDWAQGGPIIEREWININKHESGKYWEAAAEKWMLTDGHPEQGPTPLIAAMRCYVASKLGEEIEIPEVLKWQAITTPAHGGTTSSWTAFTRPLPMQSTICTPGTPQT